MMTKITKTPVSPNLGQAPTAETFVPPSLRRAIADGRNLTEAEYAAALEEFEVHEVEKLMAKMPPAHNPRHWRKCAVAAVRAKMGKELTRYPDDGLLPKIDNVLLDELTKYLEARAERPARKSAKLSADAVISVDGKSHLKH